MFELVGHNGDEFIPGILPPYNRRAFNLDEFKYPLLKAGWAMIEFSSKFQSLDPLDTPIYTQDFGLQIKMLMKSHDGLLLGSYKSQNPHAMAWNASEKVIYDPTGPKYRTDIDAFRIDYFTRFIKIGN